MDRRDFFPTLGTLVAGSAAVQANPKVPLTAKLDDSAILRGTIKIIRGDTGQVVIERQVRMVAREINGILEFVSQGRLAPLTFSAGILPEGGKVEIEVDLGPLLGKRAKHMMDVDPTLACNTFTLVWPETLLSIIFRVTIRHASNS